METKSTIIFAIRGNSLPQMDRHEISVEFSIDLNSLGNQVDTMATKVADVVKSHLNYDVLYVLGKQEIGWDDIDMNIIVLLDTRLVYEKEFVCSCPFSFLSKLNDTEVEIRELLKEKFAYKFFQHFLQNSRH